MRFSRLLPRFGYEVAKEPYKRDDILQKRPIILRSLLIIAIPYFLQVSRSYVQHNPFKFVTWLIHVCNMTYWYVWHELIKCVTWLHQMCDMTQSYVWHDWIITWGSRWLDAIGYLLVVGVWVWTWAWAQAWVFGCGCGCGCGRECIYVCVGVCVCVGVRRYGYGYRCGWVCVCVWVCVTYKKVMKWVWVVYVMHTIEWRRTKFVANSKGRVKMRFIPNPHIPLWHPKSHGTCINAFPLYQLIFQHIKSRPYESCKNNLRASPADLLFANRSWYRIFSWYRSTKFILFWADFANKLIGWLRLVGSLKS